MNRRLLDPFEAVELPDIIEEYLDHGTALCMAFNRRGTLLASGTKEGQVVIWDFDTRGVAAALSGHEGPVTSVAWSRNGRYLLSGAEDHRVILWRVLDGAQVASVTLASPVVKVSLSPRPPHLAVVSLTEGAPVVLDFGDSSSSGGGGGEANVGGGSEGDGGRPRPQVAPLPVAGDAAEAPTGRGGGGGGSANGGGVAVFSRGGDAIIGAYLRGALCVVDTASRRIVDVVRVPARVSDLVLNRKGSLLLATCQDQRLRMYEVALPTRGSSLHAGSAAAAAAAAGAPPGPAEAAQQERGQQQQAAQLQLPSDAELAEALASKAVKSGSLLHGPEAGLLRPLRDFQNVVERTPWCAAAFSNDSEHVLGSAAARAQMQLYVWNRPLGNMERMLEGPKESVLDLAWHPLRSLLLCCASSGKIYIWAKVHAENWSAFAPDFKELDENQQYVEREDEFDWNTPGAGGELVLDGGQGDGEGEGGAAPLDILTRERLHAFSSDEEEEEEPASEPGRGPGGPEATSELLYLPVVVEPEVLPPSREEGEGTEAEGEGDGEEPPAAASGMQPEQPGGSAAAAQQQQQLEWQQQQRLLLQLQSGRLAQFPRQGTPIGGAVAAVPAAAVAGAPGVVGGQLGSGFRSAEGVAQGIEASRGVPWQQWPRQAPGDGAAGAAGQAGGGERRVGWLATREGEEGRGMTDDMDDGGGGQQPGRKRKVQFDEGALEMSRGR